MSTLRIMMGQLPRYLSSFTYTHQTSEVIKSLEGKRIWRADGSYDPAVCSATPTSPALVEARRFLPPTLALC